jgi:hypothetical protein
LLALIQNALPNEPGVAVGVCARRLASRWWSDGGAGLGVGIAVSSSTISRGASLSFSQRVGSLI